MSVDIYSGHTIGLDDPSYVKINILGPQLWSFYFSCQLITTVTSSMDWAFKLPKIDPSYVKIHPLGPKLWSFCFSCQLICTVT